MIIQGHLDLEKVEFHRILGSVTPEVAISPYRSAGGFESGFRPM
jgi:hypothetical protein